jgi:hypothetical protein
MLWQYLTNSFQTHAGRSCLDKLSLPGMDRLEVDLLEEWSSIEEQIQPVDAKNVERASRKEPSKLFTSTQILMTGPGVSFNSGLGLASRIFHRTVSMAPQPGQLLRIDAESPELRRDERLARLRRAAGLPGSYWDSWLCTSSRRISGCETGIAESRRIGEVLYPSKAVAVNSAGVRGKQINLPREVWRVSGRNCAFTTTRTNGFARNRDRTSEFSLGRSRWMQTERSPAINRVNGAASRSKNS